MIAGCSLVAKDASPDIEILGVEAEAFPSLARVRAGLPPQYGPATVAEGIAVKTIGRLPLAITSALVSDVLLTPEPSIERAIHLLLEEEKLVVEGAGAVPVAALLDNVKPFRGKRVGIVISGGNIDTGLLANVINRARLREGRVVRMRVEIDDRPSILADVARIIGECGANILDVTHQRLLHDVPSKNAELDITFETRSPADVDAIARKLHGARYVTSLLESTARSEHHERENSAFRGRDAR